MIPTRWGLASAASCALLSGCMGSPDMSRVAPVTRRCAAVVQSAQRGLIEWYHPVGIGDNERLEAWCTTLGPVVIDSLPSADFGALRLADTLAVAVWNVNAGAGDVMAFLNEELGVLCDGRESRLEGGAKHFVFLVQEALRRSNDIPDVPASWATPLPATEAARPGERLDVVEVASACGLALFYVPAQRNGPDARDGLREDKGNAILATLPLSDFVALELPYEAARRVVPVATVRNSAGDSLRLASVYLITTPPPWRIFMTANTARLRQVLALAHALRQVEQVRAGAPIPVEGCEPTCDRKTTPPHHISTIVAGDLNTWSNRETALRQLRVDFPHSPPSLREPTRPPFTTDHLLFRRRDSGGAQILEATYRRVDNRYYSDHHPILAWFTFER